MPQHSEQRIQQRFFETGLNSTHSDQVYRFRRQLLAHYRVPSSIRATRTWTARIFAPEAARRASRNGPHARPRDARADDNDLVRSIAQARPTRYRRHATIPWNALKATRENFSACSLLFLVASPRAIDLLLDCTFYACRLPFARDHCSWSSRMMERWP